jgi:hypothetical protein
VFRSDDAFRKGFVGQNGNLYAAGMSNGGGWPAGKVFQDTFGDCSLDVIVAKFTLPSTQLCLPVALKNCGP